MISPHFSPFHITPRSFVFTTEVTFFKIVSDLFLTSLFIFIKCRFLTFLFTSQYLLHIIDHSWNHPLLWLFSWRLPSWVFLPFSFSSPDLLSSSRILSVVYFLNFTFAKLISQKTSWWFSRAGQISRTSLWSTKLSSASSSLPPNCLPFIYSLKLIHFLVPLLAFHCLHGKGILNPWQFSPNLIFLLIFY